MLAIYGDVCENLIYMANQAGELPGQFLDAAFERYSRIEVASSHVAKAVALELADVIMDPDGISDEQKARFAAVAGKLVDIIGLSQELLTDIVGVTGIGVQLGSGTIVVETTHPEISGGQQAISPGDEAQTGGGSKESTDAKGVGPDSKGTRRRRSADTPTGGGPAASEETQTQLPELYGAIVDPASTPEMQVDESKKAVLSIWADDEIKLGDNSVVLRFHQRYLFNALMRLRDMPREASEIQDLGFYLDAKNKTARTRAFNTQIGELLTQVNQAAGREVFKIVEKDGNKWYVVNPHVVLEDNRSQNPEAHNELRDGEIVKKK